MPLLAYRIQKLRFVASPISGEGARLYGGRWNPVGTPLVYASTSPELALLEVLVHLDGTPLSDLPPYAQVTLSVPDDLVEIITLAELPLNWHQVPGSDAAAQFLLPRLQPQHPYLAFVVPSSVSPNSPTRNVLLNPTHPRIGEITVVDTISPFIFDERLRPVPAPVKRPGRPPNKRPTK